MCYDMKCTAILLRWSLGLRSPSLFFRDCHAWPFHVVISGTVGLFASSVMWIKPTSRGGGIPKVKTMLGGSVMPNVLSAKTLFMNLFDS